MCSEDVLVCVGCRAAVIEIAAAVAEMCRTTRVNAVNEIEYTDPFTGRVSTVRRTPDGGWDVTDVRHLGSAERARCRPATSEA